MQGFVVGLFMRYKVLEMLPLYNTLPCSCDTMETERRLKFVFWFKVLHWRFKQANTTTKATQIRLVTLVARGNSRLSCCVVIHSLVPTHSGKSLVTRPESLGLLQDLRGASEIRL